jgi:SNF2 family DNA or RNA helicase
LYRQGQKRPVMLYRIVAQGTIDERILRVLTERQNGHEALIAALKAEVRETVVSQADRLKEARAAMQRAHPDRGGSDEAFIAARKRFEEEKRLAG